MCLQRGVDRERGAQRTESCFPVQQSGGLPGGGEVFIGALEEQELLACQRWEEVNSLARSSLCVCVYFFLQNGPFSVF